MPLRAVVLDFDGVIADTERLHFQAFRDALASEHVDLSERDYDARYLGYSDAGAFEAIARDRDLAWNKSDVRRLVAAKAIRMETLGAGAPLFPGAAAFVRDLSRRLPIAIASGALRADIVRVLDREDLTRCFRGIVSAEDVAQSKPSPEPYLRALELLSSLSGAGIPAAGCVAIEDSRLGLQAARAAGLRTVAITHSYNADELATADLIVAGFAALDFTRLSRLAVS